MPTPTVLSSVVQSPDGGLRGETKKLCYFPTRQTVEKGRKREERERAQEKVAIIAQI